MIFYEIFQTLTSCQSISTLAARGSLGALQGDKAGYRPCNTCRSRFPWQRLGIPQPYVVPSAEVHGALRTGGGVPLGARKDLLLFGEPASGIEFNTAIGTWFDDFMVE